MYRFRFQNSQILHNISVIFCLVICLSFLSDARYNYAAKGQHAAGAEIEVSDRLNLNTEIDNNIRIGVDLERRNVKSVSKEWHSSSLRYWLIRSRLNHKSSYVEFMPLIWYASRATNCRNYSMHLFTNIIKLTTSETTWPR